MRGLIAGGEGLDGPGVHPIGRGGGHVGIVHMALPGGHGGQIGLLLGSGRGGFLGLRLLGEAGLAVFEEGRGLLGEGDIAQHVLIALGSGAQLLLGLFKLGLQGVGKAALHHGGVAQNLLLNLGVDGGRGAAVLAPAVGLDLLAYHLVATAGQYVLHGLRTYHLAGGGDQRRITQIGADFGGLGQSLVQPVQSVHHLQL